MAAALFTLMKCARGGEGVLPPKKCYRPFGPQFGPKIRGGGPSPECATGKRFLQLFLGILKPVSLLSKRYQLSGIELTYD